MNDSSPRSGGRAGRAGTPRARTSLAERLSQVWRSGDEPPAGRSPARRALATSGALALALALLSPGAAQAEQPEPEPAPPALSIGSITSAARALDSLEPVRAGRRWLEQRGVTLAGTYTAELFNNARGGFSTEGALEYRGLLDLILDLDTEGLGLWEGGRLRAHFQAGHGPSVTLRHVGAAQCVSNIEAPEADLAQVSALYYRQALLEGRLWLQVGKQDGNDEFAASEHALPFLHSSAGFPPNIPMASYPAQEWGLLAGVKPLDALELKFGVFQGDPDGGRSLGRSFARLRGPFAIGQASLRYELAGREGQLQLGGWFSSERFPELERGGERFLRGNHGLYAIWDQRLWVEREGSDEGLSLFAQLAWSRPDRSEADGYLGAGLLWRGLLPERGGDELGLAAYLLRFSRHAETERRAETAVELFYRVRLLKWLSFTPDAQLVHHPGGTDEPTAFVLGARVTVEL